MLILRESFLQSIAIVSCLASPAMASDADFVAKCESVIAERLRSPASMVIIDTTDPVRDSGTLSDYLDADLWGGDAAMALAESADPGLKQSHDLARKLYEMGRVAHIRMTITYDADNAFGASIRATALCEEYIGAGQDYGAVIFQNPKIDGLTSDDWKLGRR